MSSNFQATLGIIKGILEDDPMKRWQDPKIETRHNAPRPYYYIRPYIPEAGNLGLVRRRKLIRLGFVDEKLSTKQLQAKKQEIMAPINRGKMILQAQIPFSELVAKYMEGRFPKLGATTKKKYVCHIDNHILPVFGKAVLADIDKQSIEAWLNRERCKHEHVDKEGEVHEYDGCGSWALADLRNILSAIYAAAIDWGLWQGANPCEGVKLGQRVEKRERRIPEAKDLCAFMEAIHDTAILSAEAARLVALTAVVSGLRVSEVLALQPEDIDPRAGTLQVARRWSRGDLGPTKSKASRRLRQIGPLAQQLLDLGKDKHFIFEREPGLPPDDRDLQQHVFRPAAEAVGIYTEGFGMHSLRALNVSWRQEAGATPFEAMKAAGHSKLPVTWLYTVTDAGREKAHVETILARLKPSEIAVEGVVN